jgi:hypothetical protein
MTRSELLALVHATDGIMQLIFESEYRCTGSPTVISGKSFVGGSSRHGVQKLATTKAYVDTTQIIIRTFSLMMTQILFKNNLGFVYYSTEYRYCWWGLVSVCSYLLTLQLNKGIVATSGSNSCYGLLWLLCKP